jgi:hypothetical protein
MSGKSIGNSYSRTTISSLSMIQSVGAAPAEGLALRMLLHPWRFLRGIDANCCRRARAE